jgi:hypothetical protein
MMSLPEPKPIIGTNTESVGRAVVIDSKDLFGARVIQVGTENSIRGIDIGLNVYIDDYMRAYVDKYYSYMYYDECLHGHNYWGSAKECDCPIKKPYITEHFFEANLLMRGVEEGVRVKVQRWKALEVLNDFNNSATQEAVRWQRPVRWVYFLG